MMPHQRPLRPGIHLVASLSGEPHFAAACQKRPDLLQTRRFRLVHADDQPPASQSLPSGSSCMRQECWLYSHYLDLHWIMRATTLALLLLVATAAAETKWDAAGKLWWSHVRFLADDKLEGRNVGSAGFETAADYVVGQFERAGLEPGAHAGYSQPVGFTKITLNEAGSQLTLLSDGAPTPVVLGGEALITSTADVSGLEAPLVFAGYGLDIPEAGYSDLKEPGLKGAIAVYLTGGPANISSELRAHRSSGAERGAAMRAAGVVGTIGIPNPRSMEIPWSRQSANRLLPRMGLADPVSSGQAAIEFSATWN